MKIRKSFRVEIKFGSGASEEVRIESTETTSAAHSGESDGLQSAFRPDAERYRRRLRAFVVVGGLGFLLVAIALMMPESVLPWLAIPGILGTANALVIFFTLPKLVCPGCRKSTDGRIDRFCPACGQTALRKSAWLGSRCNACGKSLGSYKYRSYVIRFCTHCGALLSPRGV